ncbi:epidermal retinol dehydrogenase 2 [Lampetra fluviatilis]
MNFLLETLMVMAMSIVYWLECLFRCVVPPRRKSVAGQVVLVTGAGSGLGRLMALSLARLGATLVIWDVNRAANEETAQLIREEGDGVEGDERKPRVHAYSVDCSRREDVYRVADLVKRDVGDIDILVNNAGIVTGRKFIDSPDELLQKTMDVNIMAHFWTYKAFLPAMVANDHGHLVSIASSAGLIGVNGLADYCASKFAAVGFAESVALEMLALGKFGVKTTIVCPYFINTGMFNGCATKWPRLMPILDQHYASNKIIDAILREQVQLVMPRSLYGMMALKNIIPVKLGVLLGNYFGAFHFMDHFVGRKND